ncbi:uncharacterized protein [Setaria viridis]|uniref:uncharacterized protein n=1 Tax=Setaria viridis TaxID=4556 RepID=UPI003B3A4B2C
MAEAIGQFGPGYEPPSLDYLREPLLDKTLKEMNKSREKHEREWRMYGCTLMIDSWTDRRNQRHLINFLLNSYQGTFFLELVDASDQSHDPCLDLMLEDIGNLKELKKHIELAKHITTFMHRHARLLKAAREKIGGKNLLRLVNSDDMPALPGVYAGMDLAKKKINDSFANKPLILRKVMDIVEGRWAEQNEHKLDEAALFLDPRKFYDIRKNDSAYAYKWWTSFGGIAIEVQRFAKRIVGLCCSAASDRTVARRMDNEVTNGLDSGNEEDAPFVFDDGDVEDDCGPTPPATPLEESGEQSEIFGGNCLLHRLAVRIVALCCIGLHERDWSTFESIHMRKRNTPEYKRVKVLA